MGLARLETEGRVLAYNLTEIRLAGLATNDVVGRHFFTDVAPCTNVAALAGCQRAMREGTPPRAETEFVFRFASGARLVRVRLVWNAVREVGALLIELTGWAPPLRETPLRHTARR